MLYIKNAAIYAPELIAARGCLLCDAGRITAVGTSADLPCPDGADVLDAGGQPVVPGFVEMQLNGAFGDDFTVSPETIWRAGTMLPRYGVTAFLPTIITSPLSQIERGRRVVTGSAPNGYLGAVPLGLHLEGPFLNAAKKGAHNPQHILPPTLGTVEGWTPDSGVRMVTLAPEQPGALAVIAALASRGILVSTGHSMATFEEATAAFDAGARYGTHLFNAMPSLGHRDPGLPGALLTDSRVTVGLIADAVHTHRAVIRLVWQCLGPSRLNLVSDAMAALGMPPGRHVLGDFDVIVDETSARLPGRTLAGSILQLDQAVRNVMTIAGVSLADVLPTVTTTPARALGLDHERGRIRPGYIADLVILTHDLHVATTITAGRVAYRADRP